ncbi:hypothetical protein NDU88_002305 [Pleurodeles waltl]|uniref:Uncharacterized protein n=1 Tax=Pleurodeles waltl TaxID=8319 RepID=A0AAV7LDU4_PLEWA|nr:hypothetical protein NDU88_002305 [Pleurodeles waltl]
MEVVDVVLAGVSGDATGREVDEEEEGDTVEAVDVGCVYFERGGMQCQWFTAIECPQQWFVGHNAVGVVLLVLRSGFWYRQFITDLRAGGLVCLAV